MPKQSPEAKHHAPDEEFKKMNWNDQVVDRVNGHHNRIRILEAQIEKLLNDPQPRTVDDLAGNNRKINE